MVKIGIITVSDRASAGLYEDLSGKAILELFNEYLACPWEHSYLLIPDEQQIIEKSLIKFSDEEECDLILTTGGTGPAVRDVTPEATEKVCHKILPGFGELMRKESLNFVPTAILSRQTAGVRNKSLIINLPGKPKSIKECLDAVLPAVPYCVDLIGGNYIEFKSDTVKAFRPKK